MSHDDREDKLQLLALLLDIHRHLEAGNSIHPDNKTVLNLDAKPEVLALAPTLTEFIGGILQEMMAEDLLEKDHQKFERYMENKKRAP